jgi:hypothetical protein
VFKDLTGLTENQKNAMASLTTAMGTSEAFAGEAFKLSMAQEAARNLDRTLDQIESANKAGLLTDAEASQATRDALLRSLGEDATQTKDVTELSGVTEALNQLGTAPSGSASITRSSGENSETVSVTKDAASALTIGSAPVERVVDLPDILTETPLIMDKVDSSRTYVTHTNSRKVNTVRDRLAQKVTVNGAQGILDLFQSAVDANLLTIDGDNYKYRAKVRVGYPADPANLSKAATPAVSTQKYPLVVILHGRADSWIQSGSPIDTGKVAASGHKVFTIALTNQRNHAGYDYLQKWLAEPGRAMVSVSIETNITNQLDLLTKMRAQIVIDVLTELEKRSATDPIFSKVDFQNIGLMGHSRGGEAVVLIDERLRGSKKFGIRAVCSLAPTDILGCSTTANAPLFVAAPPPKARPVSYLVMYGGLDFVLGERTAGQLDVNGSGFRLYDRSTADKAMVYPTFCCHSRFNTVWEDAGKKKALTAVPALPPGSQVENGIVLPGAVHSGSIHQALAKEYIGGFFDLTLNKDAGLEPLFNNTLANASQQPVAIQWRFGKKLEDIDNFSVPNPLRTDPTGATVVDFGSVVAPSTATVGSRALHVPHLTKALVIDLAAVGGSSADVKFKLAAGTGVKNLNDFDAITFGLGRLYPVNDQTTINAVSPPGFVVKLTDSGGDSIDLTSTEIYQAMANGWARPAFKAKLTSGTTINITLLFQQTVTIDLVALRKKLADLPTPKFKPDLAATLSIVFDTSAGTSEFWLNSVTLVKK